MRWKIEPDHLERAVAVVTQHARRTPVIRAPELGPDVWLKLENEQDTGSFKLRGALAALHALDQPSGVITASAGSHGYGLANAGARLGIAVTVFVATSTPKIKRDGIAAAGAILEEVDARGYDELEALAKAAAKDRGVRFVSAFDDADVAAGNGGTVGLEVIEDVPAVRTIVMPVGGGGLMSGLAAARAYAGADFELVGVQSEACPAMVRSLEEGAPRLTFEGAPSLAEGLEGGVSETTFAVARDELARMELVSEAAIADAMRFASRKLGLAIEGSAAVVIAWLREHAASVGAPVVGIVTGGNVDAATLKRVLDAD